MTDCWCIIVCKCEGRMEQMLTRDGAYRVQEGPWIHGLLMQPWLSLTEPHCERAKKESLHLRCHICKWKYVE